MKNFLQITKMVEKFASDNAPTILTAVGVVGTVGTAYLTHRATNAATLLTIKEVGKRDNQAEMANESRPPALTKSELFKLTWMCYIPPVAAGSVTITSIVFANRISAKRLAALAAGYSLVDGRYEEYKAKMQEKLGKKKEADARDEIAQERTNENPPPSTLIIAGGKTMFRDEPSGRYFESTMEDIKQAVNEINYKIMNDEYAVLTDFYDRIGLPPTSLSEEYGWNLMDRMEVAFHAVIQDGKPCIVMDYNVKPVRNGYNGR